MGKLSCWQTGCHYNWNETCFKDGVIDASRCPDYKPDPFNEELAKKLGDSS